MTGGYSTEAAEAPVTSRTTTSITAKVLTTREIEDVVYQTVYACQNDVLQVNKCAHKCKAFYLIIHTRHNALRGDLTSTFRRIHM